MPRNPPQPKAKGQEPQIPKKFAKRMKDGTVLCPDFQHGKCKEQNCKKGRHACAVILKNGRVCGGRHIGMECRTKGQA